jgi:hypothetical protein
MPPSRIASWFAACVLGGWLVVYNVLRLGGDSPSSAAIPGLVVGGSAGLVVFAAGAFAVHRLHASGRVVIGHHVAGEPTPSARSATRAAGIALAVAGLAALAVAAVMTADYLGIEGARPKATVLVVIWNVAFGLWVLDEAWWLHREDRALGAGAADGEAWQGLDAVWFGALLTCVLAGVAYSRDVVAGAQVALVAVVGVAAVLVAVALWMLRGGRGVPFGAAVALVVAAGSLMLPVLV